MEYLERILQIYRLARNFFLKRQSILIPGCTLFLFGLGSVCLLFAVFFTPKFTPKVAAVTKEVQKTYDKVVSASETKPEQIMVDIAGAVEKPGIYTLTKGQRVSDLLALSGGFHKKANKTFIARNLNLAQKLQDEQKIYIPFLGEETVLINTPAHAQGSVSSPGIGSTLININSASQSELESLTGIGSVKAQQIISARPYTAIEELVTKKIVSQKVFGQIQALITY